MKFEEVLRSRLDRATHDGLLRTPLACEGALEHPTVQGRQLVSFATNDYLGLGSDPQLRSRLADAARELCGPGSSRAVAGTTTAHRTAERALAQHVRHDDARVLSSAYAANLAVFGLLSDRDLILSDALNHASIIDGCRLSRAGVLVYDHCDVGHLESLLRDHAGEARTTVIVTESLFSMDADVAPLAALQRLSRTWNSALVVDEAHALGTVGPHGEGCCSAQGVVPDVLVGGLGKAFGLAGGFVAGSDTVCRAIDNFARPMLFSTALHPAIAAAVPYATELLRAATSARARLASYTSLIRQISARAPHRMLGSPLAPFVPVLMGSPQNAVAASNRLRERGFWVPVMRPPTVAEGTSRMRWSPTGAHTLDEVRAACAAFHEVMRDLAGEHDGGQQTHAAQR